MPNFGSYEAYYDPPEDTRQMAKKTTQKRIPRQTLSGLPSFNPHKPTLVVVGESMVDPADVAGIKKIRSKSDLYIVILKSQPNMEFPLWANGEEIATLLTHFNVVE